MCIFATSFISNVSEDTSVAFKKIGAMDSILDIANDNVIFIAIYLWDAILKLVLLTYNTIMCYKFSYYT